MCGGRRGGAHGLGGHAVTLSIMRAMALSLMRDRGALLMTFVLPALLFLLFAAIFAASGGQSAGVTLAIGRGSDAPAAARVAEALSRLPDIQVRQVAPDAVESAVASGTVDAGLIIRDDPSRATDKPPFVIVTDPGREVAGAIVTGRLQTLLAGTLPDIAMARVAAQIEMLVGPFSAEQKARLADALAHAHELVAQGNADLVAPHTIAARAHEPGVTYYAGAIAMLFLLFSAIQGAVSLVEERRTGVFDRIVMVHGGVGALVSGKMAFLILQGVALAAVLFAVAQVVYGVDVTGHALPWLLVSVAAAGACAGILMPLAAFARTRQQAQTLSTFAVLLLSSVGGSMVPRFLMPSWLQRLGDLTPTAWGIDAYQAVLWRGAPLEAVLPAVAVLAGFALAGWGLTYALVRRYVHLA